MWEQEPAGAGGIPKDTKMITDMSETVKTETDPDPMEQVANHYNLTIEHKKYWVYLRDLDTNMALDVYRPHTFRAMTPDDLAADIRNALGKHEISREEWAEFWAAEREGNQPRRRVNGQYRR